MAKCHCPLQNSSPPFSSYLSQNLCFSVHRTGSIVVDCKCFFQPEPSINRVVVERAFQDSTSNVTGLWLGSSYQLQGLSVDSLELAIEAATYKTPLKSAKENFRLNFRISNLPYSPELQDSRSQIYQVNKEKIEKELDAFRTSSLKDYFAGCTVESFGPVRGKAYTNIASICKFTLDPSSGTLQKQEVSEELKRLTHGFTKLGPSYELEEQSMVVEGNSPLKTDEEESERSGKCFWGGIDPTATEYWNYSKLASYLETETRPMQEPRNLGLLVGWQQTAGTIRASQPEEKEVK
ncbi:mucin-16-like [Morphnus guianensis]